MSTRKCRLRGLPHELEVYSREDESVIRVYTGIPVRPTIFDTRMPHIAYRYVVDLRPKALRRRTPGSRMAHGMPEARAGEKESVIAT